MEKWEGRRVIEITRPNKKHFLFAIVLMCASLLFVGMIGSLMPVAYSLDSPFPEEALVVFNDVVGLDMEAYSANMRKHFQDVYFGVLLEEVVQYNLESNGTRARMECTFTNGTLRTINVWELVGVPNMIQPVSDVLEMAKGFLSRYQNYSGFSHCDVLKPMLDTVTGSENVTTISDDVKLVVTVTRKYTSFRWTYTLNGGEATSKCLVLNFERGFLNYFIDNWNFYKIGGLGTMLSREEAIDAAIEAAENYSWRVSMGNGTWLEVTEFNITEVNEATLMFSNDIWPEDARGGDPLTLYPRWRIKLHFDKLYPGKVYGVNVGLWGDTGEVHRIRTMIFMGDSSYTPPGDNEDPIEPPVDDKDSIEPPTNQVAYGELDSNQIPIAWVAFPIAVTVALTTTMVYYRRKRKHFSGD
jgi:hypothetical protein